MTTVTTAQLIVLVATLSLLFDCSQSFLFQRSYVSLSPRSALASSYPSFVSSSPLLMAPLPLPLPVSSPNTLTPRIQKIKELTLQKDILRDITASEFALKVELTQNSSYIDYERLIDKLEGHLKFLQKREAQYASIASMMAGSYDKLIERISSVQKELKEALQTSSPPTSIPATSSSTDQASSDSLNSPASATSNPSTPANPLPNLRILVREDGSVDWDGALASGREVAKFTSELWERLNGREEGLPSFSELFSPATVKIPTTEEMERLKGWIDRCEEDTRTIVKDMESVREQIRRERREGGGAVSALSPSAPLPLATALSPSLLRDLRALEVAKKENQKKKQILLLQLDMEKICAYLLQELETSVDISEQRGLVAEVALIDKQLVSLMGGYVGGVAQGETEQVSEERQKEVDEVWRAVISLVDEDELNLVANEIEDLKSRLGLTESTLVPKIDWGSMGKVLSSALGKVKTGIEFFSDGLQTLFKDVQYASLLIVKAIQGTILKPREVNILRRTGRDLLTLIPFTIILIIPLSPIGHVLVFSFIQRFFPEFYPSCFSEKRLNLKKLYSEIRRNEEDGMVDADGGGSTTGGDAGTGDKEAGGIWSWMSNFTKRGNDDEKST